MILERMLLFLWYLPFLSIQLQSLKDLYAVSYATPCFSYYTGCFGPLPLKREGNPKLHPPLSTTQYKYHTFCKGA